MSRLTTRVSETNARTCACCVLLALGALSLPAVNFPVGTFIIHGLAKNERNVVIGASPDDTAYRMQAVATNGTILAESEFRAPASGTSLNNFLLEVPLSVSATGRTAAVDDTVRLWLVKDGQPTAVSSEPVRLHSETGVTNLVLQLYATVSYTNKSGKVATLPRDYVQGLGAAFPGRDPVTAYDPFGDYDGDGASNYLEYRSATDPFDSTDRLSIRAFERTTERVKLTFEYVGGVVYGVQSTPSLAPQAIAWKDEKVATDAATTPAEASVLAGSDVRDVGNRTIYLLPAEKADSMFYKLEVK